MSVNEPNRSIVLPYSFHTFIYPFCWDDSGKITRSEFLRKLSDDWEDDYIVSIEDGDEVLAEGAKSTDNYQIFQYFNSAARNALFLDGRERGEDLIDDDSTVVCRILSPLSHTGARYIIRLKEKVHELLINAIRLKVFNSGVAVLIFEMEYHPSYYDLYLNIIHKNVREINEYGRRLYPEFIPIKEDKKDVTPYMLCAEELILQDAEGKDISHDYFRESCENSVNCKTNDIEKNGNSKVVNFLNRPSYLPQLIQNLLNYGKKDPKTEFSEKNIDPAIDDRMFVCCCIVDDSYVCHFLGYDPWSGNDKEKSIRKSAAEWEFEKNWDLADELYALLNIDAEDGTCQNFKEIQKYLSLQIYGRWLEYGTLHGVTNHAITCISGIGALSSVINPFLTLYTRMSVLVLAQRASLIAYDKRISLLAKTRMASKSDRDKLLDLQKEFSIFQSQILLEEVTSQIQGIEIYKKLQDMLFIKSLESSVQNQINNLTAIVGSTHESNLNFYGLCFAIAALVLAVYQGRECFKWEWIEMLYSFGVAVVALSITFLIFKRK